MAKKHKKHHGLKMVKLNKVLKIKNLKKLAVVLGVGFTVGTLTGRYIKSLSTKARHSKMPFDCANCGCCEHNGTNFECDPADLASFASFIREFCDCEGCCHECANAETECKTAKFQETKNDECTCCSDGDTAGET